ncbi:MAG: hypothetical protein WAO08_38135, partial [Hyphomicrobiaceae bacterium]
VPQARQRQGRGPQVAPRGAAVGRGRGQAAASASPKTGERRSLRKIAAELAALGHLNVNGGPYSAKSVKSMINGPLAGRRRKN